MSANADAIIRQALHPGERVLWSGRPGIRFRKHEVIGGAVVGAPVLPLALAAWSHPSAALIAVVFAAPAL